MSLLTPVDAVPASGLVVSLLVISISLGSSPPRTSGLSDNTGNLYPATSESVLFPSDEESENPCYYFTLFCERKVTAPPDGPLYFAERSGGTDGTLCFWLKTQLFASYEIDTLCIV